MLRHEEAQKRLQAFHNKKWNDHRARVVAKLSGPAREIGYALLGRDAAGKVVKNNQRANKVRSDAVGRLERVGPRDRQKVFAALFPQLVPYMEGVWQLTGRLPYQTSSGRKGFRAPTERAATQQNRYLWLWNLVNTLDGYDPDITWVSTWAAYLSHGSGADALGLLLAAALDAGGPEADGILEILKESASQQHEIGSMGRHVSRALLVSSRPDAWEYGEKVLLAAQRQEGLRQVVLETIDEAHPEAFRRMLRLILDRDLVRFSSVVRAVNVWFGLGWDSVSTRVVKQTIEQTLRFLEDPEARGEALASDDGEALYLALWTLGFEDAAAAVPEAARLLADKKAERRFVAVHFLTQVDLPAAHARLPECLADEHVGIALHALQACPRDDKLDLFGPLEGLLARMPERPTELKPLVWPWTGKTANRQEVAGRLLHHRGNRPATSLIPYIPQMGVWGRAQMVEALSKSKTWDSATRDTLFALVGDSASWVRERALKALQRCTVNEAEAQRMEGFLSRKNGALRRGVLTLLHKQKTEQALASADRLLASSKADQRLGGLELLRQLVESKRMVTACRQRATAYRDNRKSLSEQEEVQLDAVLDVRRVVPTLDDALGLMDPSQRSKPVRPQARAITLLTPAALACLTSLDDLIKQNRETTCTINTYRGDQEMILGSMPAHLFPSPHTSDPVEEDVTRLPLRELWESWFADRPKKMRDRDDLELLRAFAWYHVNDKSFAALVRKSGASALKPIRLKHSVIVRDLLKWLLRLHPPAGGPDFLLDAVETAFAAIPAARLKQVVNLEDYRQRQRDWRVESPAVRWLREVSDHRDLCPDEWKSEHLERLWQLMHFHDEPAPGVGRMRPELELLLAGRKAGTATEADLFDQLLGPRRVEHYGNPFDDLQELSSPKPPPVVESNPELRAVLDRCRARILAVELARGENPTAASRPAQALRSVFGLDTLLRVLTALGKKNLSRRSYGLSRAEVLTRLLAVCYPLPGDTPEAFAERMKGRADVSRERLLELGFLAPQWLVHVEHTLGWPGLREAIWWFFAHMPYGGSRIQGVLHDFESEEAQAEGVPGSVWERLLRERTPLTTQERREGAVDVAWFQRAYAPLGLKRWLLLSDASKFACSTGTDYKKAVLLADVLLGRAKKRDLVAQIRDRKLREPVRLLGLMPLASAEKQEADLLGRYRVMQEYRRYARQLGPMSKEGALRTVEIGLENLARTAGYPDPTRLEWAMEAREVADLAAGPVAVTVDGVTVTLALDADGHADVSVRRGDKELKAIPTPVRKNPKVRALAERKADLKRQASRMRLSLETALCRGDTFTGAELRQIVLHPVLRPLLERLVLLGEGIAGYPVADGQGLSDHTDKVEPIKADEKLRIAHPYDLMRGGTWHLWQRHCFASERVQPFKQVFRELYVVTAQEKKDGTVSLRYAGQQVNPSQATALFGSRNWSTQEGVSKTFFNAGLTASVSFRDGRFTPLEVEGWTFEGVEFRRRGEWKPMPLTEVPPLIFSEVMRDLDLVVSVAHRGGVDPEASASTVEMRTSLLRETCSLLKIDNYRVKGSHALIDGHLGNYTVHLGSAVVHRMPGGSLCIVPVHAQHRGRLFLPFADDDPRTAEVLSKVILLARDNEIQDPNILDQLR
jgi:hypothetical protein